MATHQFIRSMVLNSLFQNRVNSSLLLIWNDQFSFQALNKDFPAMKNGLRVKMVYLGEERIDGNRHELDFDYWNTEQGDPSFL